MNAKTRIAGSIAAAALFAAAAVAPAWAIDDIKPFGQQETVRDAVGTEIGYTVRDLSPSADVIPFPVAGRLYEAMVTANAVQGAVTPVIPFFNARSEDGSNYRVLANVFTPQGLSGAPLPPGGSSTGKLYFDVVGPVPNSVVYNNGTHDVLGWVDTGGAPATGGGTGAAEIGGGAESRGVTGSTGPNFTGPSTTAGDQNGAGGGGGQSAAGGEVEGGGGSGVG
ncbi:DUF1942 domain-containing protein [Mycolicibacterium sp. P1-18]|uniref:MPT63 family protein n=1 Tax=Mycolicibacterium sp. P1-18 TaxID=2024615 RepID=UPI0011F2EEF9|nr:MPT63 family protein [Mycolicibacterium sp. P1-18]KAA0099735.1 DUF1942 domain-containing protein [Mycolicibacterium sp. P1-18]